MVVWFAAMCFRMVLRLDILRFYAVFTLFFVCFILPWDGLTSHERQVIN